MQQRSFNCWYDSSRQRFPLHSVKATAASSGGKVGTVCCAAKAACEYKAMDVYFMQTGACTPFPGLLHHLTVSRLRPSVVPCATAMSIALAKLQYCSPARFTPHSLAGLLQP